MANHHHIYVHLKREGGKKNTSTAKEKISKKKSGKAKVSKGATSKKKMGAGMKAFGKLAAVMLVANKVGQVVIRYNEARHGDQMAAHNQRIGLQTATTFGVNVLKQHIQNALFENARVSRENTALNRDRELFNMIQYGERNKRV